MKVFKITLVCLIIILGLYLLFFDKLKPNSEIGQFKREDCSFYYKNKKYYLKTDAADLLEALGDDYQLHATPSCVYEGEDKEFRYQGVSIFTFPRGETDIIDEIFVTGEKYKTIRGISVGDSFQEVVEKYGQNYHREQTIVTYTKDFADYSKPRLLFVLNKEDIVESISYYSASNMGSVGE